MTFFHFKYSSFSIKKKFKENFSTIYTLWWGLSSLRPQIASPTEYNGDSPLSTLIISKQRI